MYLRPVRLSELAQWLLDNEFDTMNADTLAQKLIDKFDILTYSMEAV